MPPRSKNKNTATSSLLEALLFLQPLTKDMDAPFKTHILFSNKWAVAYNGILTAGHPIEEEIYACPNSDLIITALQKCKESVSITLLDNNRLSIKSGKFSAKVPCLDPSTIQITPPDNQICQADDRFKEALSTVGILNFEDDKVITRTVLMNGASLVATDRKMIIEAWHGVDLPPDITLPKVFIQPLTKAKYKITGFGFSNSSVTFYFENGSWIKTQCYSEKWPDITSIMNRQASYWNVPEGFYEALKSIEPFSDSGNVFFGENKLQSHLDEAEGATHECSSIPKNVQYPIKYLNMLNGLAQKIDFNASGPNGSTSSYCLAFMSEKVRGLIAGRER